MMPDDEGSVTRWLGDLKAGDSDAAQRLWERYFGSLVRLANARLRNAPRGAEDEEDAALSAFDSFCTAAAEGRFPRLDDRDDLWRILVTLTNRKALNQVQRQRRQKRGGGRVADETALGKAGDDRGFLDGLAGSEPSPEFAVMVADEFRQRLDSLRDDSLRRIALMRMEGYTNEQIAERLDCGLRSVSRKLELIRRYWLGEDDP
jgi:DNA-directed RNA polymerase specialized sigma24 family protein